MPEPVFSGGLAESLVFGQDATPGLVAFALAPGGSAITVWRHDGDAVEREQEPFRPFVLAAERRLVHDAAGLVALERLDGDAELRWIARFGSWTEALAARDLCRERLGDSAQGPGAPYAFLADPTHQYLLSSGRTSFRGLGFAALRRLAFDIEVVTTDGFEFPNAARPGDRIVAVAVADTTGFADVLRGDRMDEKELLEALGRVIRARDPDVLEGHNVFRFDLPYLDARARMLGVPLAWGRDGSLVRGRPSRLTVADRTIAYQRYHVAGRHVVDTWMLAQIHDAGTRDLPSFGLKDIARHLGLARDGRAYLDAGRIGEALRDDADRLMAYAADDARETLALGAVFSPPYFAQAQVVPFDYQSTVLRGAAAKIDALLMREYVRRGHAVPLPRPVAAVGGGHVETFQQGVARPVLHVDVTSLYPSIMLADGIRPASDALAVVPALLGALTAFRVRAKQEALGAASPDERAHLGALAQSFKILVNAFYGYLAFGGGHWNDGDAANRVTGEGRRIVGVMIESLCALGAVPVEADTDGVYFVPPGDVGEADVLVERIRAALPAGIHVELDGRWEAMLSYKPKTYALRDRSGRLVLKGSAFRSRALEPFQRRVIEDVIGLILRAEDADAGDVRQQTRAVVDRWLADFTAHRVPVRLFARTETLHDALDVYRDKVASGARGVAAAYEVALASGRSWQPGDQVSFYVAGRGVGVSVADHARLASEWNPERPDENVDYYRAKVLEVWERLRPFAEDGTLRPWVGDAPEPDGQLSLF
jgi:DNA polymerase elongation subunit (family B)